MRGSMDTGRRLGCRGGASPTGASWSPAPPARPIERGRHPAAVPPQPSTRSSTDPGGTTPDVRHPASGSTRPLGTHMVGLQADSTLLLERELASAGVDTTNFSPDEDWDRMEKVITRYANDKISILVRRLARDKLCQREGLPFNSDKDMNGILPKAWASSTGGGASSTEHTCRHNDSNKRSYNSNKRRAEKGSRLRCPW
ncbi:hypothetical protein MRX96_029873 [Rhipicephalus microplus]